MRGRSLFWLLVGLLLLPDGARADKGAFWRSLLVPGWGQHYLGRPKSAARFLAAEVALWGGYVVLERLGDIRAERFRAYAAEHAGARPEGKDKQYLDDLGFYESRLQHNQFALYDEGPRAELYAEGPEYFWEWDGEESRQRYRALRNESRSARRQALYLTGLVVTNHLFAAVHAGRAPEAAGLEGGYDVRAGRFELALVRRFY